MSKDTVRSIAVIIALAVSFGSGFFFEYQIDAENPLFGLLNFALNVVFLGAFVIVSYYRRVSINTVFFITIAIVLVSYLLASSGVINSHFMSVSAIGVFLLGSAFSTFPIKDARRNIILGFAFSAPVYLLILHTPLINTGTGRIADIIFFLAMIIFLFLTDGTNEPLFPSVRETIASYRPTEKKWSGEIFSQRDSVLPMLPITLIFFFIFGMFESYANAKGIDINIESLIMVVLFAVCLGLLWLISTKRLNEWFNSIIFAMWTTFLVSFSVILLITDMPPALFSAMGAAMVIVHIPLWIFLTEASIKQSLSPLFLYGILTLTLFFFQMLGRFVSFVLIELFGLGAYNLQVIVGVALAFISLGSAFLFYIMLRRERSGDGKPVSIETGSPDTEAFMAFCDHHQISEREAEVIKLYSQGRSVKVISSRIHIAESTVRTHIQRAYAKLEIHSKQELLDALSDLSSEEN